MKKYPSNRRLRCRCHHGAVIYSHGTIQQTLFGNAEPVFNYPKVKHLIEISGDDDAEHSKIVIAEDA